MRKAGDVLAEIVMLRDYRHEVSARASAKTELLFIPRSCVGPIVAANAAARAFVASRVAISSAGGLISQLFDLRGKLDKSELEELIRSVGVKQVAAGKEILKQDSREDRRLYVVRHGEVRVVRQEEGTDYPLATLRQGDTFGEKACLMRQEQFATVVAATDVALLVIPEKTVQFLLERNPKLREALEERVRLLDRELQRQKKLAERRKQPAMLDLESKAEFGEKVIPRFACVQQAEEMDCGAACLAMICKHYGIGMTLGKLRELANVTTQGATLESLARTGESLGFTTRGMQCTYRLAARLRAAAHRALGGLPLHRGVWRLEAARVGGRPRDRLQEDDRGGVRARLERHLPGLHARRRTWRRWPRRDRPGCGSRGTSSPTRRSCSICSWRRS